MNFCLYHRYSDGSGMSMIYVGCDKAEAFDALMKWNKENAAGNSEIHKVLAEDLPEVD